MMPRPPQQHLYKGLARPADYSVFAREWTSESMLAQEWTYPHGDRAGVRLSWLARGSWASTDVGTGQRPGKQRDRQGGNI